MKNLNENSNFKQFPKHFPIGASLNLNTTAMSTAVHWPVDDIDDALAADFDGSLSGLGMELGTSSFNMSEALMALPSLKSENHNHHNHHHHNHTNGISRNHNEGNGHHSPAHSQHSNSSQKGNNSDSNSSTLTLTLSNHSNQDDRPVAVVHGKKNRLACGHDDESVSSAIKRFCVSNDRDANSESIRFLLAPQSYHKDSDNNECNHEDCAAEIRCQHRHSNSVPDLRSASSAINNQVYSGSASPPLYSSSNPPSTVAGLPQILSVHHHHVFSPSISSSPLMQEQRSPLTKTSNEFQYVLGAATAVSTKLHEETMTYLNQGQPYEIKLKKLGDLSEMRGKMLKSLIRVGFHERRLQFMEKDLINQWKQQRQTERILDIDIPLSYGIFDIAHDSQDINRCEFMWDPTKETGVFVKVNCISTEFTPKKHGGEKGVPFRLIIETHNMNNNGNSKTCVHAASCQVKVFKPKGADRKHKTDREKMSKRPQSEQDKFQPSCDCTVFTEYPIESIYWSSPSYAETQCPSPSSTVNSPSMSKVLESTPHLKALPAPSTSKNIESPVHQSSTSTLSSEATASETSAWLRQNRFEDYIRSFSNFSGADLLRLNRHDLTQICGLTDGIRLYNALNLKAIRPRLTLYICHPSEEHFNAIYLENLTVDELKQKLASVVSRTLKINRICLSGPSDIKVLITDEVIRNMNEESMFYVEFDKDSSGENMYNAILSAYK